MSEPLVTSRIVSPRTAALLLAMAVVLLGTNWPTLKIVMRSISPLWFTTVRMAGACFFFTLFLALRGKLIWPTRRDLPMVLGLGVLQFGIMSALVMYGVSVVGAGRSAMLVYTSSIWVTLGAVLVLGEKPSWAQLVGLVCGIAGLVVLFSPFGLDWHDRRVVIGNGCVVLGAMIWSVALLQVRGHRWHADPIQLMPAQTFLGFIVGLPLAMAIEGPLPNIHWNAEFVISYLLIVILATCVSFWALATVGRSLPAIAVSLGQLATPVIGVLCATFMVAEIPSWADIAGLLLIVAGVAVAAIFGRRRAAAR